MTAKISRLYITYPAAEAAVRELEAAGLSSNDVSIVASNAESWFKKDDGIKHVDAAHDKDRDGVDDRREGARTGAGIGIVAGGAAGLLAGLGMLAIPGIGPIVAAGWLTATLAGVAAGGTAGGVIGALVESGVSKEEAEVYAEGIRRGGALVVARVPDADRARYQAILQRSAVDLASRGAAYRKEGWTGFDPAATPYSADDVRRDRSLYR